MKVVCLLGSPRAKSNSAAIAARFSETAGKSGAEVKSYTLNSLKYRGCQACMACKTKLEKCALKDDLSEVLDAVAESDVVVIASPVYFGGISGQLKTAIDRFYSFLKPNFHDIPDPVRLAPGKKLVFIITQGNADENMFDDIFPKYDFFMKWYGFAESRLIRACGLRDAGEIENRQDILALAEKTAREICAG